MRRFTIVTLWLAAATVASTLAAAPYDVTSYELRIEPDFVSKRVSISTTIGIDNPDRSTEFAFGLNQAYESVRVHSNDTPIEVEHSGGVVRITTSHPTRHMELVFELEGDLGMSGDDPRAVVTDSSLYLLWSDRFYPIAFQDWASMTTTVILPEGYDVIAPGRRVEMIERDGKVHHLFESSSPIVCASVIAANDWIRSERVVDGRKITLLLDRSSQAHAEQIFDTSSDVLSFYSDLHGDYPFDEFAFVTIDGIHARRAFPGFVGYSPAYLAKELSETGHDAHETALLWWGYTLRGSGPASFQWTEGFGDYVEFLYDEHAGHPIPRIFQFFRTQYLERDPETEPHYTELRGNMQDIVHGKLPWLMHLVRYRIGDAGFRDAIQLLFERFRHRTFTIEELVATLEEAGGESLSWWRDEWLERPGVPRLSATARVEPDGSDWLTSIRIEQDAPHYRIPIEIAVDAGTRHLTTLELREGTSATVVRTADRPRSILLDPDGWLLFNVSWPGGETSRGIRLSSQDQSSAREQTER